MFALQVVSAITGPLSRHFPALPQGRRRLPGAEAETRIAPVDSILFRALPQNLRVQLCQVACSLQKEGFNSSPRVACVERSPATVRGAAFLEPKVSRHSTPRSGFRVLLTWWTSVALICHERRVQSPASGCPHKANWAPVSSRTRQTQHT